MKDKNEARRKDLATEKLTEETRHVEKTPQVLLNSGVKIKLLHKYPEVIVM